MATITKVGDGKDARYRVRVVVGYKPDGSPRQRMRTFDSQRDAVKWGREQDTARERGTIADAGRLTLGEHLDQWLARCERRVEQQKLRGTTLATYRMLIDRYVKASDSASARLRVRLDRLKTHDVQAIIDAQRTAYCAGKVRSVLRIALNDAVRQELIEINPTRRTTARTHHVKEGKAWTAPQAQAFLQVARDDRYRAYWYLAVYAGLRPSELFGLAWDALDLHAGTMRVVEGRVYLFGETFEGGPKSRAGKREIMLPEPVVAVLRDWRAAQLAERLYLGGDWAAGDLVVTGSTGKAVDRGNLTRRFKQLCAKAAVPSIRLYDLRHSYGSLMLANGADLKTVSTLMGHSDTTLLQRVYAHSYAEQQRQAMERLANVLGGTSGSSTVLAGGDGVAL